MLNYEPIHPELSMLVCSINLWSYCVCQQDQGHRVQIVTDVFVHSVSSEMLYIFQPSLVCWCFISDRLPCQRFLVATLKAKVFVKVPSGSPSRGGDVTFFVGHKSTKLAHSFLFGSFVCFFLYGPFNCISFHKFSPKTPLSHFLLHIFFCLIGPFNYISFYESLPQPWYNPLWLSRLKAPITN